jgi:hypothetical protein
MDVAEVLSQHLPGRAQENHTKTSVRISQSLIQDFNLGFLESNASIRLTYNVHTVDYKMVHVCLCRPSETLR